MPCNKSPARQKSNLPVLISPSKREAILHPRPKRRGSMLYSKFCILYSLSRIPNSKIIHHFSGT